jgi:predicted molibdopterin-dependent oxidoreductase YjgC
MFRLINDIAPDLLEIEIDGESVTVPGGISVAAAMLYLDAIPFRQTIISQSPRAPFCLMGICFECLVEVDGVDNQRACQVEVQTGMQVKRLLVDSNGASV